MPDAAESQESPSGKSEMPDPPPGMVRAGPQPAQANGKGRPEGRPLPDQDMPIGYSDDFAVRRRLIHVRTLTPSSPRRAAVGSGMVVKLDSVPVVTRLTFPASTRQ